MVRFKIFDIEALADVYMIGKANERRDGWAHSTLRFEHPSSLA
jgi:hypothetical protein